MQSTLFLLPLLSPSRLPQSVLPRKLWDEIELSFPMSMSVLMSVPHTLSATELPYARLISSDDDVEDKRLSCPYFTLMLPLRLPLRLRVPLPLPTLPGLEPMTPAGRRARRLEGGIVRFRMAVVSGRMPTVVSALVFPVDIL